MPEWLTWGLGVIGAIGGIYTGWAAIVRAGGQNRNEERSQLTKEQIAFRQSLAEQLTELRTQLTELNKSKDALEAQTAEQGKQIAVLSKENEYQAREMKLQAEQIGQLRDQNAKQAGQIEKQTGQIETLTEERQQYIEKLAVVQARATWLESELNIEREQNLRLKALLPTRFEVTE